MWSAKATRRGSDSVLSRSDCLPPSLSRFWDSSLVVPFQMRTRRRRRICLLPSDRPPAFLFGHFYRKFRAERKIEISSMADFTLSIVFGGHRNMSILLTLALPLHTASSMTAVCPRRGYVVPSRLAASPSSSPSSHPTPRPWLRGPHDSYARKETGQTGERGESTFNAEERGRSWSSLA